MQLLSVQSFPFHQEREQHMFKIFIDIGFNQIDPVLAAFYFQFFEVMVDISHVSLSDLPGIQAYRLPGFKVNKAVRPVTELKFFLQLMVGHMKQDHFVLVIPEVLKG